MARSARSRLTAAVALGAGVATLSGCSFANPIQTLEPYAPSDGVRVEVTDGVFVENLLVVAEDEGEPGRVLGAVNNATGEQVQVTVTFADTGESVSASTEPDGFFNFTDEEFVIQQTPAPPGGTATAEVSTATAGAVTVEVPVLDDTHEHYEDFVPSGS